MSEKTLKTRIIHKHDTEAHWNLAENFIPKQGELIVYDIDDTHTYERFKIGDGQTLVSALPFADTTYSEATTTTAGLMSAADKEKLDGLESREPLPIEVDELPTENIDDSKIYILNRKARNAEVYLHTGTEYMSLSALLVQMGGTAYYYIVDELPTVGELSDINNNITYCYIFNDIPYIYVDLGEGASWTTVSAYMGGEFPDKGVTNDITAETEAGIYVFYTANIISKSFYLYNNNQWEKLNNAIVDVTELPTENADKNVIYRLTKADFYSSLVGILPEPYVCNVVNELPSVGNPIQRADGNSIDSPLEVYYVPSENKIYGYVDENLSQHYENTGETYEVGWYSANEYLGSDIKIIFDIAEATGQELHLLVQSGGFYVYTIGGLTQINGGEIDTSKDYAWSGNNSFSGSNCFLTGAHFGDTDIGNRGTVKFWTEKVYFTYGTVDFTCANPSDEGVTFNCPVDFTNAAVTGLPEHIVDIAELPTENIDSNIIYRTPSCVYYYGYQIESDLTSSDTWMKCNPVDGLPEIGNPAAVLNTETGSVIGLESYYNIQDGTNSGYVDDTLAGVFGITKGWYSVEQLFAVAGRTYNGIVSELPNEINTEAYYLLVQHTLWNYKEGKWIALNNYNIYIDSNKASQPCAQEQWNRVTLSPETVVLVIPSVVCLGFRTMQQNPGSYALYGFDAVAPASSLDAPFDHLVGVNAQLLKTTTGAPTISIDLIELPASDTLAIKNEENSFSKLNTFNGDAVFNSNVDFTNATVTGLPASGLTQEEVQELIDTAINGALGGNY